MTLVSTRAHATALLSLVPAIAVAVVLWVGFTTVRDTRRPDLHCGQTTDKGCSVADIMRRDPYCTFDPTCVSPGFVDAGQSNGTLRQWQGFYIVSDPGLIDNPLTMLAIPNYVRFVSVIIGSLVAVRIVIPSRRFRHQVLAIVLTLFALELSRWVAAAGRIPDLTYPGIDYFDPRTYGIVILLALPVIAATLLLFGKSRAGTKRPSAPRGL